MDIGEEDKPFVVEPAEDPFESPDEAPAKPVESPELVPSEEELVPA